MMPSLYRNLGKPLGKPAHRNQLGSQVHLHGIREGSRMDFKAAMMGSSSTESGSSSSTTSGTSTAKENSSPIIPFTDQALQITIHKFNGTNYLEWPQSVCLVIDGKIGYLTSDTKKPPLDDPRYQQWRSENSLVTTWLINSMDPAIGKPFLFLPTANEELDFFEEEKWACPTDAVKYQEKLERNRIFVFLARLNSDMDEVRGHLLGRKPLPNLREVFSEVRCEESRRQVMLKPIADNKIDADISVLTSQCEVTKKRSDRQGLWCDVCRLTNHNHDSCWRLHGKPMNWKPRVVVIIDLEM